MVTRLDGKQIYFRFDKEKEILFRMNVFIDRITENWRYEIKIAINNNVNQNLTSKLCRNLLNNCCMIFFMLTSWYWNVFCNLKKTNTGIRLRGCLCKIWDEKSVDKYNRFIMAPLFSLISMRFAAYIFFCFSASLWFWTIPSYISRYYFSLWNVIFIRSLMGIKAIHIFA